MVRIVFAVLSLLLYVDANANAAVDVYLFWRDGCPHCEREIEFLDQKAKHDTAIRLHYFEVGQNDRNRIVFRAVADYFATDATSVPFTVIGDAVFNCRYPFSLWSVVYMPDDLVIFFIAMITLQATGLSAQYSRYSHLLGGIILVIIASLLWFKPQWLSF